MDNQSKTSFIPKRSFAAGNQPLESSIGLMTLISFIVLASSLIIFAGAFGYQYYLANEINRPCNADGGDQGCGLRESLAREKRELDVTKVSRLANLDAKMKTAQSIVNNHTSVVPLLDMLESQTLHTIQFTSLNLNSDNEVSLSGITKSYEDIAVQLKAFQSLDDIKSASFSGFSTDEFGNVRFNLSLSINQNLFKYKK